MPHNIHHLPHTDQVAWNYNISYSTDEQIAIEAEAQEVLDRLYYESYSSINNKLPKDNQVTDSVDLW